MKKMIILTLILLSLVIFYYAKNQNGKPLITDNTLSFNTFTSPHPKIEYFITDNKGNEEKSEIRFSFPEFPGAPLTTVSIDKSGTPSVFENYVPKGSEIPKYYPIVSLNYTYNHVVGPGPGGILTIVYAKDSDIKSIGIFPLGVVNKYDWSKLKSVVSPYIKVNEKDELDRDSILVN